MRTVLRGVFEIAIIVGGCAVVAAQDNSKSSAPASAQSMPMPKPDPQMTKLIKMMGGTWTVVEKSDPSAMMPTGGMGKGTSTITPGPGGLSLVAKYHSSGMMGNNFNGLGVFWWDAKAGGYRNVWCDSGTPTGCDGSGLMKWDGTNLTGTMQADMPGQKMVMTMTYTDWTPDSFVMKMAMGPDASSEKEMMTITYTRSGGASMKAAKPMDAGH